MGFFSYQAISEKGKKYEAVIDADSLQEAKLKLLRKQILVLSIQETKEKKHSQKLSKPELLNLTREIARLLQAGLPLYETLNALEEKYQKQKAHRLLLSLCDHVKSGHSFSQSLAQFPKTFDLLYVSMVANSEKTGRLELALLEISELLQRQLHVRKQVLSALLYPALLSGFCLIVLSSLLFYVIPSLKELFEGRELHPFTRLVFAASQLACNSKGVLLFSFLTAAFFSLLAACTTKGKERFFSFCLRLPFFKSIFIRVAFARFFRAAATLLEGGLPLLQSIEEAQRVLHHPPLEKILKKAKEKIGQGASIHSTFENEPLIPPLIPRMIAIAEEGGKLPFMMKQIAQIYEEELEKTLTQFASVAQPALLLLLGAVIGFVLLSVLLPMTDVSSFATHQTGGNNEKTSFIAHRNHDCHLFNYSDYRGDWIQYERIDGQRENFQNATV